MHYTAEHDKQAQSALTTALSIKQTCTKTDRDYYEHINNENILKRNLSSLKEKEITNKIHVLFRFPPHLNYVAALPLTS